MKEGYTFQSQTDTEVLVQLIEYMKKTNNSDLPTSCTTIESNWLVLIQLQFWKNKSDLIVAARKGSPLVIGRR